MYSKANEPVMYTDMCGEKDYIIILMESCVVAKIWCFTLRVVVVDDIGEHDM